MKNITFNKDKDQSQFEKALEEAKKQMSETNKKFAQAMLEIKKAGKIRLRNTKLLSMLLRQTRLTTLVS